MFVSPVVEKLLNDMISRHKQEIPLLQNGEALELEIRFKDVNREMFESLFSAISTNPEFEKGSIECTINTITENAFERSTANRHDDTQYIRKMTFVKGTKIGDTYMQKSRIVKSVYVNDYVKYSVGLSKESTSRDFATGSNASVRAKVRASFDYLGKPPKPAKWRFDLTVVKAGSLAELGPELTRIRDGMFKPSLSIGTFLRDVDFDLANGFEIEIEYIGKDAPAIEDFEIVKKVFALVNPEYLSEVAFQEEVYRVAEYVITNQNILPLFKQNYRLKQLSNQAKSITKNEYYSELFPPDGYYLTDKADGIRCVVSINGNRCRLLTENLIEIISDKTGGGKVSGVTSVTSGTFVEGAVTIADAEMIYTDKSRTKFDLYLFDCMVLKDENVSPLGFSERLKYIPEAVKLISSFVSVIGGKCSQKHFVRLDKNNLEGGFREIYEDEYPYETDGMIMTEPDKSYHDTRNFKWKPLARTTIDFLAVKCPQRMLGIKPYDVKQGKELYLLFVGINHEMREKLGLSFLPHYKSMFPTIEEVYYPIQFSPSINPHAYLYYHDPAIGDVDRKIVELRRDENNIDWLFVKTREDRKLERNYFGNDYRTAELTYINYIDPLLFEELWKPSTSYFTKTSSDIYLGSNKYKRYIVSLLIKDNLSNAKWVIDLAAGRGADLHRYQEVGVENLLNIDRDPTAIAELIRRKFDMISMKKRKVRDWFKQGGDANPYEDPLQLKIVTGYDRIHGGQRERVVAKETHAMTIHTLVMDLTTPYEQMVAETSQFGLNPALVDGTVCNFAIHYLCDTVEHIRGLLKFVSKMLKIGGVFMFTTLNGKKVFDLLKDLKRGEQWEVKQDNIRKYALKKLYNGDKLANTGQTISVLLPLSDTMYEEPLCNIEFVVTEAERLGLSLELNASFDSKLDQFKRADQVLYDKLTDDDKFYIGLHQYVTLRKVKDVKV